MMAFVFPHALKCFLGRNFITFFEASFAVAVEAETARDAKICIANLYIAKYLYQGVFPVSV